MGVWSGGDAVQVELAETDSRAQVVQRVPELRGFTMDGCTVRGRTDDGARALPPVSAALEEAGITVTSATLARPSLDDVYLQHTCHSLAASDDEAPKALEAAK